MGLEFKYAHRLRLSLKCLLGIYYPNAVKCCDELYYNKRPSQSPLHPTTHLDLLRETRCVGCERVETMLWFPAKDDEVSILYKGAAYVVIDGFKPVKFVVCKYFDLR